MNVLMPRMCQVGPVLGSMRTVVKTPTLMKLIFWKGETGRQTLKKDKIEIYNISDQDKQGDVLKEGEGKREREKWARCAVISI